MKVYIVLHCYEWETQTIIAVFYKREAAEVYIKEHGENEYDVWAIEEHEVL